MSSVESTNHLNGDRSLKRSLRIVCGYAVLLCGFFVLAMVLQQAGFSSPPMYDSDEFVFSKENLYAQGNPLPVIQIVPVRPLFMISLYANYVLTGMNAYAFRTVNALILAAAGMALVILCRMVLELANLPEQVGRTERTAIAIFLGALFVAHPLQTYVVLYIWQRGAIMACLFYFAGTAAYLTARSSSSATSYPAYALTGLLFLAGILSKENLGTLPATLLLAELTLFRQRGRELVRRGVTIAAITVPVLAIYFMVTQVLFTAEGGAGHAVVGRLQDHYRPAGWSPMEVALTQARILFDYLGSIVAPTPDGLLLVKAETVSRSLLQPPITLLAVLGAVSLAALGFALVRRLPVVSFGILFVPLTVAPESLFIPQYLFFGYRAILPMAGVLTILGYAAAEILSWGLSRFPRSQVRALAFFAAACPFLFVSAVTVAVSSRWQPLLFWKHAFSRLPAFSEDVEKTPYGDILVNFGKELVTSRDYARAAEVLDRAVVVKPQSASAHNNLGNALLGLGLPQDATEAYRRAIALQPASPQPYLNMGAAWFKLGRWDDAREAFEHALRLRPQNARARANLGSALVELGRIPEAIANLKAAIKRDPGLTTAHYQLGLALQRSGEFAEAAASHTQAIRLAPNLIPAHYQLALCLIRLGRPADAITHLETVVRLDPAHAEAHNKLGELFLARSEYEMAGEHFQRALAVRPDHAEAAANLEKARQLAREQRVRQ